jgi:hypothetical protein
MVNRGEKRNKIGQMNISFGIIFAIVVGAFILFLAIFVVIKFTKTETGFQGSEASQTIGILTNPLESSFESSTTIKMSTPVETQIYTGCRFEPSTEYAAGISYVPEVTPTGYESPGEMLLVDEIFVYSEDNDDETAHGFKFWSGNYLSQFPQDWSDYYNGEVYMRFEVISQPTNTPFQLHFGIWQNGPDGGCHREAMSHRETLNGIGDVVEYSHSPNDWWVATPGQGYPDADAPVDWSSVGSFCRLGVPLWSDTPKLVSDWPDENEWGRRNEYMPLVVRASVVAVDENSEFSGWENWINPTPDTSGIAGIGGNNQYFGRQQISTSQKSYGQWTEQSKPVEFNNKYIFSNNPSSGRNFYVFSKPFEFPYKVADLVYVLSADKAYCFVEAGSVRGGDLEEEIQNLNQPTLTLQDDVDDCIQGSIKVCFRNHPGCDIRVGYNDGYVRKLSDRLYFEGDALMFAAIFSDEETYECQVSRLMKRAESLADIYDQKYDLMLQELECDSELKVDLLIHKNLLEGYSSPSELRILGGAAYDLGFTNGLSDCRLW